MYCINNCLSDLWVLLYGCCTFCFSMWSWISYGPFQCSPVRSSLLKSHHHSSFSPSLLLDMLCLLTVAIRGSGVDHLIGLPLWTPSCCWMPPWLLFLPPPLVLVAVHVKIFHLIFWSYLTPQYAQCALLHSTRAHEGSSGGFLFFLNPGLWSIFVAAFCCSKSWLAMLDVFSSVIFHRH
jgi:hypothetical protein